MEEMRDYIVTTSSTTTVDYRVRAASAEDATARYADGEIIHSEASQFVPDSANLEE